MRDIYLNHLTNLRESQKISFAALEDKTGITQSTLCRWFQGKGTPTVDELEMIFNALGGDIRDVFADVGEQELRASRKLDYKGTDALLLEFERREKIYKEHCDTRIAYEVQLREQLQVNFGVAIKSLESSHEAALKKRDETYDKTVGYLKEDLRIMHDKNRELMDRAIAAEKRADISQSQHGDSEMRRDKMFHSMLALCVILSIVFFAMGVMIQPPWEWMPIG